MRAKDTQRANSAYLRPHHITRLGFPHLDEAELTGKRQHGGDSPCGDGHHQQNHHESQHHVTPLQDLRSEIDPRPSLLAVAALTVTASSLRQHHLVRAGLSTATDALGTVDDKDNPPRRPMR